MMKKPTAHTAHPTQFSRVTSVTISGLQACYSSSVWRFVACVTYSVTQYLSLSHAAHCNVNSLG